jgi:hypothetical protein
MIGKRLAKGGESLFNHRMKFAMAFLSYILMGIILGAGILLLVAGKPLFFILAVLGYIVFFGWVGCATQ